MKKIKIALVGQPNVGKSNLINAISGADLHVGNFSGVTVEHKVVEFKRGDYQIEMVDLPGLYSLNAYTPEEVVSKKYLLNEEYDLILNVLDSNIIQRGLNLTMQLASMNKKMLVAFNMYDEVSKMGGDIDTDRFEKITGIKAVKTSATENYGIEDLFKKAIEVYENEYENKIYYPERIEDEVDIIKDILKKENFNLDSRFIAIRLLQEDKEIYQKVHDLPIFLEIHEPLAHSIKLLKTEFNEDDIKDVFNDERVALSKGISVEIYKSPKKETLTERIDDILIHPLFGMPIFLFFMWGIFQLTFSVGSIPMDYIDEGFGNFSEWLSYILPDNNIFSIAVTEGIIPAVGAVVMFLPNILILYFGINLLEQTGYMARASYVMDGILKKFGLQGKAFVPLVSGFGCSVPAYMAARTLKNPKDRIITMLIIGFMSCGARLPVYVLLVGAFFAPEMQGNVMFAIYIGGAIMGLVIAKVLRMVAFKGEPEPFVMEMPKYRFPSIKVILIDLWIKTKMYLKKAGTFIAVAAFAIWFLSSYPVDSKIVSSYEEKIELAKSDDEVMKLENELQREILENSYLASIGKTISPILEPIGLDWKLTVAALSGLAAKEVMVSTMAVLYHTNEEDSKLIAIIRENITFASAVSLIILVMFYSPCLAAMGTFYSEVPQWAWRIFYTVYPNVFAWIVAFIFYNILS
jgi:ferrous iron transport protein B